MIWTNRRWAAVYAAAGITLSGGALGAPASSVAPGNSGVLAAYISSDDGEPGYRERPSVNDDDPYGYSRVPSYRPGADSVDQYDRGTRFVSGRITDTTGTFSRTFRVRLDNGEDRSIEAPRDITVRRFGRAISVHELRRGEAVRVRLERYRPEGTLSAIRVEVYEGGRFSEQPDTGYGYGRQTTIRGTVTSIDSRGNILRIDVDGRRVIVRVNRAEIRTSRGRITLRDLQNGDTVIVEGRRDRDDAYATSITVR